MLSRYGQLRNKDLRGSVGRSLGAESGRRRLFDGRRRSARRGRRRRSRKAADVVRPIARLQLVAIDQSPEAVSNHNRFSFSWFFLFIFTIHSISVSFLYGVSQYLTSFSRGFFNKKLRTWCSKKMRRPFEGFFFKDLLIASGFTGFSGGLRAFKVLTLTKPW